MSTYIATFALAAATASSTIPQVDINDPTSFTKLSELTAGDSFTVCMTGLPDPAANLPDNISEAMKQQLRDMNQGLEDKLFDSMETNWDTLQTSKPEELRTSISMSGDQSDAERAEVETPGQACRTYEISSP